MYILCTLTRLFLQIITALSFGELMSLSKVIFFQLLRSQICSAQQTLNVIKHVNNMQTNNCKCHIYYFVSSSRGFEVAGYFTNFEPHFPDRWCSASEGWGLTNWDDVLNWGKSHSGRFWAKEGGKGCGGTQAHGSEHSWGGRWLRLSSFCSSNVFRALHLNLPLL